jgi:hypothetical protein
MQYIDVDRIHDVLEGKIAGRHTGKTVALMSQLLGIVDVGEHQEHILTITHTSKWAGNFTRLFSDFLVSAKVQHSVISPYEIHIIKTGQRFTTMTADDVILGHKCRGLRLYNHFIDMPDEYMAKYENKLTSELAPNYRY